MPYGEKSAYEAQAKLKGKSSIKKKVGFGMPYQGNHSAFPFKQSPIKQFEFDAAASVAQQNATKYQQGAPDKRQQAHLASSTLNMNS
tara:strand:- start:253 stop:513 length:261 start_codon:yes stop_codon:yes gene_type:complete